MLALTLTIFGNMVIYCINRLCKITKSSILQARAGMNKKKYNNAVLFFAWSIPNLGRTKLNKLLYFLDFDHFEKYAKAVTEDDYENNDLGPVPVHADEVLGEMQAEKLIDIVYEPIIDYVRHKLVPLAHHDTTIFSSSEMEMLCAVTDKWQHHTAREMVIASHGEAPWIATRKGEAIPYALAYYRGKFEEPSYDDEPRHDLTLASDTGGSST
jgi:uncharacterized phage-associated protein